MSLTARERRNPPTRRKSCAACTKAKRRCDFAMPACLRCSQRHIHCQYPTRVVRGHLAIQPEATETICPDLLTTDDSSPQTAESLSSDGPMIEDFNAVISGLDVCSGGLGALEFPLEDTTLKFVEQPWTLTAPSTKDFSHVPERILNRLQWAVDEIKRAPEKMVLENQTPWSHPLLYRDGMPRSLQDAHSSCALYMAKNRVNSPVIFRSIESRVNDLLAAPAPVTPLECLAHTQSLILYQIIRLYDGDIGARVSAEHVIPAIEASAISLFSYAQFDIDTAAITLPTHPIAPTKAFWQDWILQESIRRTLLFSFYFVQAYRIMAGCKILQCDGRLGLCHAWTLSAHLWNAMTPLSFAEAWRDKNHYVVTNAIFSQVLDEAQADDVDVFGKIMISSLMGQDETEGWFASRGGKL
ncbi:c6 finger domain-containing [Fusarium longipes]|uniref:C6 finger domain-containing n=1 Tax=Fusarium longipes TaxID=694270 RepID=A0A395SCS0_9HYPO|nr:c6 finger domain-containing [Fusarium longipes]